MLFLFRRRTTAAEILDTTLARRDYRAAATMIVAGSLETLNAIAAEQPSISPEGKRAALTHALAPISVR